MKMTGDMETEAPPQDVLEKREAEASFFAREERILGDIAGGGVFKFRRGNQWAIDPETGEATYDPKFFEDKGHTRSQALFASFHEIRAHLVETAQLLSTPEGDKANKRLKQRSEKKKRIHLWENIRQDIKGNRSILKIAPSLATQTQTLYKEKLFPVTDMTKQYKHLQFMDAIIRRAMVPGEEVKISPEIEEEIKKLRNIKGKDVIELATDPDQDPYLALRLSEKYIEPIIDKLWQKDKEDYEKKKKEEEKKKDKNNQGQGEGEPQQGEGQSQPSSDPFEEEYAKREEAHPDTKEDKGKDKKDKEKQSNQSKKQKGGSDQNQGGKQPPADSFEDEDEKKDNRGIQGKEKDLDQIIRETIKNADPARRENRAYEEEHGITKEEAAEYYSEYQKIEPYIEPLRKVFRRIIQERTIPKRRLGSLKEEGVMVDPGLVTQTYLETRHGAINPKTMKDFEGYTMPDNIPASFSIHLVADQSGSMRDYDKHIFQRRTAILMMEALKEFSDFSDSVSQELIENLDIRTELRSFGAPTNTQTKVYKPLSKELTEVQRIEYFRGLLNISGGTNDYDALEEIETEMDKRMMQDKKYAEELKSGRKREIVIIMSDGESNDASIVAERLQSLRGKGVKVVGVGVSQEGAAVVRTYAPDGKVAYKVSDLPQTVENLLEEFLSDLSVGNLYDMLRVKEE